MRTKLLTFILLLIAVGNIKCQCNCEQNIVLDFDDGENDIRVSNCITTPDFTFSVWFRHPNATGGQEDRIFGTSPPRLELGLNNSGELWVFDGVVRNWAGNLNECVWHHAVLMKDGGTMSIYLDEVFIDSWSVDPAIIYGSPSGFGMNIGNWFTSSTTSEWTGQLDDFVILDYAASTSEISDLASCNYSSLTGNIVAHYDWNNGNPNGNNTANTVAIDLTGNWPGTFNSFFVLTGDESNYVVCESDCLPPTCPPDHISGSNGSLMGTITDTQVYATDGGIESLQILGPTSVVDYNSNLFILLEPGFNTINGTTFEAFIDGCPE